MHKYRYVYICIYTHDRGSPYPASPPNTSDSSLRDNRSKLSSRVCFDFCQMATASTFEPEIVPVPNLESGLGSRRPKPSALVQGIGSRCSRRTLLLLQTRATPA